MSNLSHLRAEQRRNFGMAFVIMGLLLPFFRAWVIPQTHNRSGYYLDWPMFAALAGLLIGGGARLWLAADRPSARMAAASALATLLVGLLSEYFLAVNLARAVSIEYGAAAPPILDSPRQMLITLLVYWAQSSASLLYWVIGAGLAAFANIVYSRDRLFAPRQSR